MWAEWIQEVRRKVGDAPRNFRPEQLATLRVRQPEFLRQNRADPIHLLYRDQLGIFRNGRPVWGRIVQANALLFEEGLDDCPAAMIHSPDPWFDANPEALIEMASAMYAVKGKPVADPEMDRFGRLLYNEYERQFNLPLPHSLTGGRTVIYTTIMVHRSHLPAPVLVDNTLPIMSDYPRCPGVWIIPSEYWAEAHLTEWFNIT